MLERNDVVKSHQEETQTGSHREKCAKTSLLGSVALEVSEMRHRETAVKKISVVYNLMYTEEFLLSQALTDDIVQQLWNRLQFGQKSRSYVI